MDCAYDAFVSYNSEDYEVVREFVVRLETFKARLFFDEKRIKPGVPFPAALEDGIRGSRKLLVCIGPSGRLGDWQENEVLFALQMGEKDRAIPVRLRGAPAELPIAVVSGSTVDLSNGLDNDKLRSLAEVIFDKPIQRSTPTTKDPDPDPKTAAVEFLSRSLKTENVNFFVGSLAWEREETNAPKPSEMTKHLLELLELPLPPNGMLPEPEAAGQYFAIAHQTDRGRLDEEIDIFCEGRSSETPASFSKLAELLNILLNQGTNGLRLIVTTSVDLKLERALIKQGISFTRVVQNYFRQYVIADDYDLNGNRATKHHLDPDRPDTINNFIRDTSEQKVYSRKTGVGEPWSKLVLKRSPVLYKFCGSRDVLDSNLLLSVEQQADYIRTFSSRKSAFRLVPTAIGQSIKNSHSLLLGYCQIDGDRRLLNQTLFADMLPAWKVLSVCPRPGDQDDPYEKLRKKLWATMAPQSAVQVDNKMFIEARLEDFLDGLLSRARSGW